MPDCAAAATLLDIVTEAKRYQGKALIAHINRAINLLIRPTPGAWVGAVEVLTFADGDCKDYSIAKFFAPHEAVVSPERVRLVIVRNHRRSGDHMVVAVSIPDQWIWLSAAAIFVIFVAAIAARSLRKPKPHDKIKSNAAAQTGWTATGRIDFVDPQSKGDFVLQVEETRIC